MAAATVRTAVREAAARRSASRAARPRRAPRLGLAARATCSAASATPLTTLSRWSLLASRCRRVLRWARRQRRLARRLRAPAARWPPAPAGAWSPRSTASSCSAATRTTSSGARCWPRALLVGAAGRQLHPRVLAPLAGARCGSAVLAAVLRADVRRRRWASRRVDTDRWGGLPLTLLLHALIGMALRPARRPAGAGPALAACRRSARSASLYVELIRGVPLITVLFMASFMFPLLHAAGHAASTCCCACWSASPCSPPPTWPR